MTPQERKKAIKDALLIFRYDIEKMRDECSEKITPHLNALGINVTDECEIYNAIEVFAKIDAERLFHCVGFDMSNICEDIAFCESF